MLVRPFQQYNDHFLLESRLTRVDTHQFSSAATSNRPRPEQGVALILVTSAARLPFPSTLESQRAVCPLPNVMKLPALASTCQEQDVIEILRAQRATE
jgi:hypothetical protein